MNIAAISKVDPRELDWCRVVALPDVGLVTSPIEVTIWNVVVVGSGASAS